MNESCKSDHAYYARRIEILRAQRDMLLDSYEELSERIARLERLERLTTPPDPPEMRAFVERMRHRALRIERATFMRPLARLMQDYVLSVLDVVEPAMAARLMRITLDQLYDIRAGAPWRRGKPDARHETHDGDQATAGPTGDEPGTDGT